MHGRRRARRLAVLAFVPALISGACGAPTPSGSAAAASPAGGASLEPSTSSPVAPAAGDLIQYPDAADPVTASRLELGLVRQIRDEAGMPALLGDGGPAAFATLDGIEAAYGRKVLLDAANAIDGTAVLGGKAGMPAAPRLGPAVIDTSLFAETGFMANALMSMLTTLVQRAGSNGSATVPREEHFQSDEGGLHQDVTLSTTITVKTGDGRASGEVRISATDRITKPDGTFVALYTSSAEGSFDVNACPDAGGIGAGTYTFQTRHELNDVSGSANARSSGGRSVQAPFRLVDGDDAKLLQVEASLDLGADARGPGSPAGPGPTAPFDWTATQQVDIVMPAAGGTTGSGRDATVSGAGGERAQGSMLTSELFAMLFFGEIGKEAERFWRSGACIDLKPSRDTGTVDPGEQVDLTVTSTSKFGDHGEIKAPIVATFTGKQSLDPNDQPVDAPATFSFEAGPDEGDVGTIDLKQTSKRGIGLRQVVYTVSGKPLLLSLTSKSTSDTSPLVITYQGSVTDLELTRQGKALAQELHGLQMRSLEEVLGRMTADDRQRVIKGLEALVDAATEAAK